MFLANKKIDNQVKTFITYNKGRDWNLLQAPDTDLRGNPVHCLLVSTWGGEGVGGGRRERGERVRLGSANNPEQSFSTR